MKTELEVLKITALIVAVLTVLGAFLNHVLPPLLDWWRRTRRPCPVCGRCPACGRGGTLQGGDEGSIL